MSGIIIVAPLSSAAFYAAAKQFYLKIWLEEDLTWQEKRLEAGRRKISVRVPATESNRLHLSRQLTTQEKVKLTIDPKTELITTDKYQGQIKVYQGDNVQCVPSMPTC